MATAALALVVVLGVLGLRAVQGTPPAATWGELHRASLATGPGPPGPGDAVVTVSPGDTLWGIARSLRPGGDPRPVVDALARANGGSTLQAGQQLLIPARLLDG
jgi:Tfp pilus assembly protein FimV